jgi:putative hydrolase of the HAD superfamily
MLNFANLAHIDTWIFDLDNTLYHPKVNLFAQIDARMSRFIADMFSLSLVEARAMQKDFFLNHGTTLRGLMDVHGVEPQAFLDYVHDIDMTVLEPDLPLAAALGQLPGRKILFTNGDSLYAARVLERLGLSSQFAAIHCILACGLQPKPRQSAYDSLVTALDINPESSIFFEDMAINLLPAKAMGMTTVWVANDSPWGGRALSDHSHIDYTIDDVSAALTTLTMKAAL